MFINMFSSFIIENNSCCHIYRHKQTFIVNLKRCSCFIIYSQYKFYKITFIFIIIDIKLTFIVEYNYVP